MKERPILMSAPMVCAILEDRKTQTRRALEPQPAEGCSVGFSCFSGNGAIEYRRYPSHALGGHQWFVKCKYGQPGDRLWVRETWRYNYPNQSIVCAEWRAAPWHENGWKVAPSEWSKKAPSYVDCPTPWKPSIHMPRWASRITLEITRIRVERLQEISKADVIAEGTPGFELEKASVEECRACYRDLVERNHGKGWWDKNPWLWVIQFKRIE